MARRIPMTSLLIFLCFLIGISIFSFKYYVAGFPLFPNEKTKTWHIESKIALSSPSNDLQVLLKIPEKTPFFTQADERFVAQDFGRYPSEDGKQIVWSKKHPHIQEVIYYHTVIYSVQSSLDAIKTYREQTKTRLTGQPLDSRFDNDDVREILETIHKSLQEKSADNKSYVYALFNFLKSTDNQPLKLLSLRVGEKVSEDTIATEILRYAGIPARQMNGILLSQAKQNTKIVHWVEAYVSDDVIKFSSEREKVGMPSNIFPWYEGYDKIYHIASGKAKSDIEFSVKHHIESALTESFWRGTSAKSFFYDVSVYNLPVELQLVMQMLLMIPVGAVVCVFIKQMIGIPTYGTFMPVLIAISFRETGYIGGLIFFSSIVAIGMMFRSLFDNMKLLVVPRLSAILTIVVGIIFFLSFLLNRFGYDAGGLSLFPLIILTMMIERMSITWEEQGAKTAMRLAFTSMFVASVCFAVIGNPYMEHLIMTFPELLFVNLSIALALGRYTGFKLTEYYRFRALQ